MSPKVIDALNKTFNKLICMSPEEFNKILEKHKNGEIAQILNDANCVFLNKE